MATSTYLSVFAPPYRALHAAPRSEPAFREHLCDARGVALLWRLGGPEQHRDFHLARSRPGGVSLICVLPPGADVAVSPEMLRIVELCRPTSVLPYHPEANLGELRRLCRRPPDDLPAEVVDYLAWRGIPLDQETRRLVRRMLELSGELRTVAAMARGLYLSRRALGRKLLSATLPVASHWLHFGRVLRASVLLQSTEASLFSVSCDMGYSDGFALSNQMKRLTGVRPSDVREYLGWEWILEGWLRREAEEGSLFLADRSEGGPGNPGSLRSVGSPPSWNRTKRERA